MVNQEYFYIDSVDMTDIDLRTREGNEKEVIRQVLEFGGFSIFWVTENQKRACAA